MKNKIDILIVQVFIIMLYIFSGCSEEKMGPFENNQNAPGHVKIISVKSGPGTVILQYSLPKDEDLLYIKAVYSLRSGVQREVRASIYNNSMTLDGFFDTEEHEVQIYCFNRSEVASEPLSIKVKANEHPIWDIYRSLEILPDFMGVKIKAKNEKKMDVAISLCYLDSLNHWKNLDGIYTSASSINQTIRGLDTLSYKMGVVLRDRFLNYTDTIYKNIAPFFEIALEKSKYKDGTLPGDTKQRKSSMGIVSLWDGWTDMAQRMMTEQPESGPAWITVDLGQEAKLSRIKIWTYPEWMGSNKSIFYYNGTPRFFEIWGSANPASDGSWDSWTLMGNYEVIKPSGLPFGQTSDEDDRKARAGFDFDFTAESPKVKYLRFKSIENWMGTTWLDMTEIQVYGDNRK